MEYHQKILCPITGTMMDVVIGVTIESGKVKGYPFACSYSSGDPRCDECRREHVMDFVHAALEHKRQEAED